MGHLPCLLSTAYRLPKRQDLLRNLNAYQLLCFRLIKEHYRMQFGLLQRMRYSTIGSAGIWLAIGIDPNQHVGAGILEVRSP